MKQKYESAEAFFTSKMSKVVGRDIPVAIMFVEFEDIDIPDPPYHKSICQSLVDEMGDEFNPLVAGFLCINVRENGKIALVDGRHRKAMAIKAGEKGWQFTCTHGLTLEEEAKLFRYFQRRKGMTQAENLKSLIISGDHSALRLRAAVHRAGCCFKFEKDDVKHRTSAVAALIRVFSEGGENRVYEILRMIISSWSGAAVSLKADMVLGIWRFLVNDEVSKKVDKNLLIEVLQSQNPDLLIQRGKIAAVQESCQFVYGMANTIRYEYNRKVRGNKRIGFDFAHSPVQGRSGTFTTLQKEGRPEVPPELLNEVEMRRDKRGVHASAHLRQHVKAALLDGYDPDLVAETFCVGLEVVRKAKKEASSEICKRKSVRGKTA